MTDHNVPRNSNKGTTTPLDVLHQFPELRDSIPTPTTSRAGVHDDKSQVKNNKQQRGQGANNTASKRGYDHTPNGSWRKPEEGTNSHGIITASISINRAPNVEGTTERGTQTISPPNGTKGHDKRDSNDGRQAEKRAEKIPSCWVTPLQHTMLYNNHASVQAEKTSPPDPTPIQPAVQFTHNTQAQNEDATRKHTNPRVRLRQVVVRLGESKLISKEVENALEEYIHTQKITPKDKDICSMEEPQQVVALTDLAKKYPYDGGNYPGARSSPINLHTMSKSSLQQKIEDELGPGVPYLITGPDYWNRLDLETTCVYAFDLVYTTTVEKEVEGRRLRFKKVAFELPESPPREWFVVDMCNNIQDIDITVQEFTARLRRLVVDDKFDAVLLREYAAQLGTPQTREIIEESLLCYVHQCAEFAELIRESALRFHARDVVILRDYLITHVLYSLQKSGHVVYLKGGCSLSLGYNLITRTSEDVDLRIDPSDGVIWEVNGKNPMAAEASRMEYFLTLIDSMLIEDGDVKLHHTKCKTTQAVYHVTFDFPRIHPTPVAIVLEVMHKVAPFYEKCKISSKLHDHMKDRPTKFKRNFDFEVQCTHPIQTLYEKVHAVFQNYNKFHRNDDINAPKWIRHLGDAYTIIKHSNTPPLPADWPIDKLQKELARSGDFVVDLSLDHPSLKLRAVDEAYFARVEDAYYKHKQDAYYGERKNLPPDLDEVCATVLGWLEGVPRDFMSYRFSKQNVYQMRSYHNNFYNHNGSYNYNNSNYNYNNSNNSNNYNTNNYNNRHGHNNNNTRGNYPNHNTNNNKPYNNTSRQKRDRNYRMEQEIVGKNNTNIPVEVAHS